MKMKKKKLGTPEVAMALLISLVFHWGIFAVDHFREENEVMVIVYFIVMLVITVLNLFLGLALHVTRLMFNSGEKAIENLKRAMGQNDLEEGIFTRFLDWISPFIVTLPVFVTILYLDGSMFTLGVLAWFRLNMVVGEEIRKLCVKQYGDKK